MLERAEVALLAGRRAAGAPGLEGGGEGAPGRDLLVCSGVQRPWDGHAAVLEPGDRVIVATPGGGGWGRDPDHNV